MRLVTGVMVLSVCVATGVAVVAQGQRGGAQQPPKNLQVLPKDWTGQQVTAFMRQIVVPGTGMQCNDCHAQDRSADDKKEKQVARKMVALMMSANDALKDVGEPVAAPAAGAAPSAAAYKVTCYTCHRGTQKPLNAPPAGGGH